MRVDGRHLAIPWKRHLTRQTLERHTRQAVLIGLTGERIALDLLRRHVPDGSTEPLVPRQAVRRHRHPREAEVRQQRTISIEKDVPRLHITMDHAGTVRSIQRAGDIAHEPSRRLRRETTPHEPVGERATRDVPHRQEQAAIILPRLVHRDDRWMLEPRRRTRLAQEPLAEPRIARQRRRHHLHRHQSIERLLAGQVHGAHPTPAELTLDEVTANPRASTQRRHAA